MSLDATELRFLGKFSDKVFEFPRDARQERRADALVAQGLLEKRMERPPFKRTEKWAYRRTAAGKQAVETTP